MSRPVAVVVDSVRLAMSLQTLPRWKMLRPKGSQQQCERSQRGGQGA